MSIRKQGSPKMAAKAVPFKRSLLINLTIGVAVLGAIMLAISLFATQQTVERLSGTLTDQVIATTDAQIMRFFEPITAEIEIATERTRDGEFEAFPLGELDGYFEPLVDEMPQISSVMYSHDNGDEYMLLQTEQGWTSRLSQPESRGNIATVRQWLSSEDPRPVEDRAVDYDSRTRPWFTGALENFERLGEDAPLRDRIHWTPPYRFFTTQEPGITASLAHRSSTGRVVVLGFDILLGDISRYTSQLKIGERGRVFVLRGSPARPGRLVIIGLPADDRFDDDESMLEFVLSPPHDFGGPVASFVGDALVGDHEQPGDAVRFSHDGEPWWGEIAASKLRTSDTIWVGAVVPERDLLAGLPNTNLIVVIVTGLVLLLAVQRGYRLAHRYSEPVEALTQQGTRMQRLNFEPGEAVDSDITEIRHLSTTLERMRSALQSFTSAREDLRVARSIRDQNLPATIPAPPGVDIQIWQDPAEELGGECYDAVAVEPGEDGQPGSVVIGIFDFSATGLAAAIGGVQLCAEFRVAAAAEGADVAAIAARLDRFVLQERPEMSPLHACLLRLDDSGNLAVLGFGWDELLHRRGDDVQRIALAETPLGIGAAIDAAAERKVRLAAGDLLVLASDGVLDALSDDRQRYRLDGLEKTVRARGGGSAASLIETVVGELGSYSAGIRGDRTLLVIRVNDSDT
jgi:serine phosphatase RsbU (regulator of sigma subunit)